MQDAGVVAVAVADLDDHQIVPLEREPVVGTVTAVTGAGGIPGVHLVPQQRPRPELTCICAIVPAVATTRAPNRSASSPAANQ